MLPAQTASSPGAESQPILPDPVKHFVVQRMMRLDPPMRIVALVEQNFQISIDREQMLACWAERNRPSTETERRPDKESVTHPADEVGEPLFTVMPCAETPGAAPDSAPPTRTGGGQEEESTQILAGAAKDIAVPRRACADPMASLAAAVPATRPTEIERAPVTAGDSDQVPDTPPTRTGPGPEDGATEVLPAEVREFVIGGMARRESPSWIAREVERKFGFVLDRDEIIVCWRDRDAHPTRTGPGQKQASLPKLNDEIKEFIVKRLACYETPSRIAAAVRINFGIDIDRRRIFDYNPAGSRPPAQRWIDLHAATRARFVRDASEIGVAQKVIRLRMLDRFAQLADDDNRHDKAAKYLEQAARECGGFYEKWRRAAVPASRNAATELDPGT